MYHLAYGKARITGSNIMSIKNILYQSKRKKDARSLHRLRAIKLPLLFEQSAHGSKTQA